MFARVRVSPAWSANAHAVSSARARVAQGQDPSRSARQRITLETLATGDAGLQFTLDRCAKVIGRKIPVLIQGESGSGKELLARACHNSGPRADGPFVAVNCAAIPEHLIESELFGYVGGAFTGARKEGAIGRIQQADGGTLFLDEIGDMPLAMQARLLRVLQERCVQPVGGSEPVPVDIALLCATHRNLGELVRAGQFREDLYYRVNGLTAALPPLRERTDLRQLVRRLIDASRNHPEPRAITVDASAMRLLEAYAWPGNIRQLQNVLEVALALLDAHEERILPEHLPEEVQGASPVTRVAAAAPASASSMSPATLPLRGRRPKDIDDAMIREALERFEGNLSAAARHLGVARNTLYRRMGCDY